MSPVLRSCTGNASKSSHFEFERVGRERERERQREGFILIEAVLSFSHQTIIQTFSPTTDGWSIILTQDMALMST